VRALEENSIVLWTKMGDIPRHGVLLKQFSKEDFARLVDQSDRDRAIKAISQPILPPAKKSMWTLVPDLMMFWKKRTPSAVSEVTPLSDTEKDELIDILVDGKDTQILPLCPLYRDNPFAMRSHSANILRQRKLRRPKEARSEMQSR